MMPLRLSLSRFRRTGYSYIPSSVKHRNYGKWGHSDLVFVLAFFAMVAVVYLCLESIVTTYGGEGIQVLQPQKIGNGESHLENSELKRGKSEVTRRRPVARSLDDITEQPFLPGQDVNLGRRYRNRLSDKKTFPLNEELLDKKGPSRHYFLYNKCLEAFGMADKSEVDIAEFSKKDAFNDCIMDNEMAARRKVIGDKCDSLMTFSNAANKSRQAQLFRMPEQINANNLLVLKSRQLVWCPVFKAASTNWMKTIPMLSNYLPAQMQLMKLKLHNPHELARRVARPLSSKALREYMQQSPRPVSFVIVRNPIERLLSAYRDKLETWREHFFEEHGRAMAAKYRERGIERFGKGFYSRANNYGSPMASAKRSGREPTFWEFARAIIDERWSGNHWDPIYAQCSLCQMDYDVVLKFENYRDEERYLLRSLGLGSAVEQRWENRHGRPLTAETRVKYFSQLTDEELTQLHEIYRPDFELFEYKFDLTSYRR